MREIKASRNVLQNARLMDGLEHKHRMVRPGDLNFIGQFNLHGGVNIQWKLHEGSIVDSRVVSLEHEPDAENKNNSLIVLTPESRTDLIPIPDIEPVSVHYNPVIKINSLSIVSSTYLPFPKELKAELGINKNNPHFETLDMVDSVVLGKPGFVAQALRRVLTSKPEEETRETLSESVINALIGDITSSRNTISARVEGFNLCTEAFPEIYADYEF